MQLNTGNVEYFVNDTVTSNSPSQYYTHLDNHNSHTDGQTLGFKPFSVMPNEVIQQLLEGSAKYWIVRNFLI